MSKETPVQEAYIANILRVSGYAGELRLPILEVCVQRLLKIDVSCTREQIAAAEQTAAGATDSLEMQLPLAARLDALMAQVLRFVGESAAAAPPASRDQHWQACKSVYRDLLFTFDKYVVRTYGSSHVQFLMFYVCGFRGQLAEGFVDYLWKKFSSPASCQVTKQICAYYIGWSFAHMWLSQVSLFFGYLILKKL